MKKTHTSVKLRNNKAWEFKFSDRIYSTTAFFTYLSQKCSTPKRCETSKKPQGCLKAAP